MRRQWWAGQLLDFPLPLSDGRGNKLKNLEEDLVAGKELLHDPPLLMPLPLIARFDPRAPLKALLVDAPERGECVFGGIDKLVVSRRLQVGGGFGPPRGVGALE